MKQQNTQKIRSVPAMMFIQHKQKQEHSKSSTKRVQLPKFGNYNFSQKHSDSKLGVVI